VAQGLSIELINGIFPAEFPSVINETEIRRGSLEMKYPYVKILLPIAITLLTGCGGSDHNDDATPVGPDWSIDSVSYTCADSNYCPDNQGILMAVRSTSTTDDNGNTVTNLEIERCTATIYDTYKILTAGHCVDSMKDFDQIWFKTAEGNGRSSRTFQVVPPYVDQVDYDDHFVSDYGSLSLVQPATGISFAHPAASIPFDISQMIALVANPREDGSTTEYELDAVSCSHGASNVDNVTYNDNPTTFVMDCKIYSGNSGGAVVSPGDPVNVLGVVTASNSGKFEDRDKTDYLSSWLGTTAPTPYAIASNMRCFSMPGWPLMEPNCKTMNQYRTADKN